MEELVLVADAAVSLAARPSADDDEDEVMCGECEAAVAEQLGHSASTCFDGSLDCFNLSGVFEAEAEVAIDIVAVVDDMR